MVSTLGTRAAVCGRAAAPTSSSAAFCSTFFQRASTASVTTASSPAQAAKPMLRVLGSCLLCRTTCGQRYSGARSASAMPLLRRSYGHHRDLSAYGSSAGATIVASLLPDHCTVTRRDEPQPAVEPMRLRPVEGLVPASITRSTTTTSTAGSPWLPPSQHLHHALTQRNYHQVPRVSPIPQSTRHSFIRSRILKSP